MCRGGGGQGWGVERKDVVCYIKERGFGKQNQVLFSQYLSKIRLKKRQKLPEYTVTQSADKPSSARYQEL